MVAFPSHFDRITVTGISAVGHHGVFPYEKRDGQVFVLDVTLGLDLSEAGRSDDLTATVDYGVLASQVSDDITGEPLDLIEALAERVARTCLAHPRVQAVTVTVHKPEAPIPVPFGDTSVTITRVR